MRSSFVFPARVSPFALRFCFRFVYGVPVSKYRRGYML